MKCLLTLFVLSLSLAHAQSTSPTIKPKEQQEAMTKARDTNSIALEITEYIKEIFTASASATDAEKANTAVETIREKTKMIITLKEPLEIAQRPTKLQKKQYAIEMLIFENEISDALKEMSKTFQNNSEEINAIIEPTVSESKELVAPVIDLINTYYPPLEMLSYMEDIRKKKQ